MRLRWFELYGWLVLGWLVGACVACSAFSPMADEELVEQQPVVKQPKELGLEERIFNMEVLRKTTEEAFAQLPYPKITFLQNEYGDIEIATNLDQLNFELKKLTQKERMRLAREIYDLIMPIAYLLTMEDVANIIYNKTLEMLAEKEKAYADHYDNAEGEEF